MSAARRGIQDRLARLGEHPTGDPSAAFATGLERRLVGGASLGATVLALPTRHRTLFPVVTAGVATLAAVVLAGALLGAFGRGGSGALQLAAAVDTTVILPGGHSVAGHTGLNLPNGCVVWTGPNGRAMAGAVELGPGIEAVVDAGRLHLAPLGSAGSTLTFPAATPTSSAPDQISPPALRLPTIAGPAIVPVPTTLRPRSRGLPSPHG